MEKGAVLHISPNSFGHTGLTSPQNRINFFESLGVDGSSVVSMHLTHTNNVQVVGADDGGKVFENTDGLVTNSKGIYLALPVGDCLPIMAYDPKGKSIGIFHAGWRGLENKIIFNGIKAMEDNFGAKADDIKIKLGACICQNHFEVKDDVFSKFTEYKSAQKEVGGKKFLDLRKIIVVQLLHIGIQLKNIEIDSRCTLEDTELFSHRGGNFERNLYLLTLDRV